MFIQIINIVFFSIVPLSQVQTLYDNFNGNKENKMPKDKDNKTKENEEKKKQQKLNAQVDNKKKLQQQKPKEKSKPVEKSAVSIFKCFFIFLACFLRVLINPLYILQTKFSVEI